MLPTAATASARSRRSSSSALSGSPRMLLRAASAVNAMPERVGPSSSCRSRRSRRRSSSMAAIAAPRDSRRSSARARARSVWASSGATIRSTCSSPADRDRSPGRRPITISPTVSCPRESGSRRVWVTTVPEVASWAPPTDKLAYGSTRASRMARNASTASSPIRSATLVAACSGSGRSPKSSSTTAASAPLDAFGGGQAAARSDAHACGTALAQAERTFDRAAREDDPAWLAYFDEAYLAARMAQYFRGLGKAGHAARYARRSLDMDGRYVRAFSPSRPAPWWPCADAETPPHLRRPALPETVSIGGLSFRVGDGGALRPAQPSEARRHQCPSPSLGSA